MNGDDITAFIAAKQGTYYVPAGDIGDYRFLYRGYWYDRHLHIYHVRHRAYDPEIQRWLQPDPAYFVDGLNRYAYCGNEPVHMYDPMGMYGIVDYVHDIGQGAREFVNPESVVGAVVNVAASFVPGVGEVMDVIVIVSPSSSTSAKAVAGVSLGVSATTGGLGPNVSSLAKLVDVLPSGAVSGSYNKVVKWIKHAGSGQQAGHLLQNAAFGDVIARKLGLSIPMAGNAKVVDTEHYKFHKAIDDFFEPYMKGGDKVGTRPTVQQYLDAMQAGLKAMGKSDEDIVEITKRVKQQLDDHGIPLDGDVPSVPSSRTTPKCRDSSSSASE